MTESLQGRSGKEVGETVFLPGWRMCGRWTVDQTARWGKGHAGARQTTGFVGASAIAVSLRIESFKFPFNRRLRWSGFQRMRWLWQQ